MRKETLAIFLFLVLMASACSAQPAKTAEPASTETPAATRTPRKTPTPPASATPSETPIPTNPPDCTNSAIFIEDVTIPDGSTLPSIANFTKTWRIKNTGTCTWGAEYLLTHYSEESMFAPASVPLSITFPGQIADISVALKTSSLTGAHRGFFVIKNPNGSVMKIDNDTRLWVAINVSGEVANIPAATPDEWIIPVTGGESGFEKAVCMYADDRAKVEETINAINAYRAEKDLPVFTLNALLSKAAAAHANDMACNKLFVHTGSNGSTPSSRVITSGYIASSVAENVYGSYPPLTGQSVVDWWKADNTDPRHSQNLLNTTYTEIGVGYSFYNNFGYYVLVFAAPK